MSDCLLCEQIAAVDTLPGGRIVDDDLVVAYHLPPIERFPWMPRDADWNALHERPDAPRGADAEIADFVRRLRPHLPS